MLNIKCVATLIFLRVWPSDLLTIYNMYVVILVYLMVVVSHGNYLSGVYYNAMQGFLHSGSVIVDIMLIAMGNL